MRWRFMLWKQRQRIWETLRVVTTETPVDMARDMAVRHRSVVKATTKGETVRAYPDGAFWRKVL